MTVISPCYFQATQQCFRIEQLLCFTVKGSVSVDDLCKILSQPEYSDLRTSPEEVRDACRIFDKLGDGMVQVQQRKCLFIDTKYMFNSRNYLKV